MDHGPITPEMAAPPRSDTNVGGGPTLVLRPRIALRWTGLGLVFAAVLGMTTASPAWVGLLLPGALLSLTWWPRLEVDIQEIRYRGVRRRATVPVRAIEAVQLRRVPFRPAHGPTHTYRVGRVASTPIRLRIQCGAETPIQLTVLWWQGWPLLVRYLMTVPEVAVDSRTRGRLERYG